MRRMWRVLSDNGSRLYAIRKGYLLIKRWQWAEKMQDAWKLPPEAAQALAVLAFRSYRETALYFRKKKPIA